MQKIWETLTLNTPFGRFWWILLLYPFNKNLITLRNQLQRHNGNSNVKYDKHRFMHLAIFNVLIQYYDTLYPLYLNNNT